MAHKASALEFEVELAGGAGPKMREHDTEVATLATKRRTRRPSRRWAWGIGVAGVFLWLGLPVVLVAVITVQSMNRPVEASRPVSVGVEANDTALTEPVGLALTWSSPAPVVAPTWSGVVQSVLVKPGQPIESGTPVARIDGIERRLAVTSAPFAVPLAYGDRSADVVMLNEYLAAHGYPSTGGDKFGDATLSGVQSYAKDIGVPSPATVEVFDPAWVVYLPAASAAVTVTLTVAAPAPSAGEEIVTLAPRAASAALIDTATAQRLIAQEGAGETTEQPEPTITAADGMTLMLNGEVVELGEDRSTVSAAGLDVLTVAAGSGSAAVLGVLSSEPSPNQWVLPSTAVISDGSASCVVVGGEPDRTVTVRLIASVDGKAVVEGKLDGSSEVKIFASGVRATCG